MVLWCLSCVEWVTQRVQLLWFQALSLGSFLTDPATCPWHRLIVSPGQTPKLSTTKTKWVQAEPRHREYRSSANLNPMTNSLHFHNDAVSSIQCVDWSLADFRCHIKYQFPTDASGDIWQRWWRLSAWPSMIVIADYPSHWRTVWSRGVQACLCLLVCRRSNGGRRFHWGSWSSRPLRKYE